MPIAHLSRESRCSDFEILPVTPDNQINQMHQNAVSKLRPPRSVILQMRQLGPYLSAGYSSMILPTSITLSTSSGDIRLSVHLSNPWKVKRYSLLSIFFLISSISIKSLERNILPPASHGPDQQRPIALRQVSPTV
jgi:hypothetical protein